MIDARPVSDATRVARNTVVQAVAFAAQGVNEFVVALVLARLAGAERLGEFTTLVILAGLFDFISTYGLPALLTREIARLRDDSDRIVALVNAALGLVIVLSSCALVLMCALGVVAGYSPILLRGVVLVAIALGVESMVTVVAAAFRGIEALDRSSAISAVMELSFMVLAVATIMFNARIDLLMGVRVASRMVALALGARLFRARFGRLQPGIDLVAWRRLLREGLPFSINSVFSSAYSRADVVILSALAGNTVVGFYEVAYAVTMRMNVVSRALTFALYPLLSYKFSRDKRSMHQFTGYGIHVLNVAGFFIATILAIFGSEVIGLIYGTQFAGATRLAVRVLALAIPLRFLDTQLGVSLDASNRAGKRATAVAIAAVANAILNAVLIPSQQIMGAVYATLITEVLICGLFIWFLRREVGELLDWRAFAAPAAGVVMILGGLMLVGQIATSSSLVLSVFLYVSAIVAFDRRSLETLRKTIVARRLR